MGDFKLTCCETTGDMDANKSTEISILEQTISEISEESNIRGKHIDKLRKEKETFNEEAVRREDELVQIIKQQDGTIHQAERKIGELEKIIESLMDTKITKTTSTQSEIKNREQEIQTIPNTTDFTMQTSQQPDTVDGSNQPNKHLQNSIKNIIREELKLSVGYIVEQISQTATKVDVLKDSNIDLVSLLTNKQSCNQNLFRNIPHSYPIQPNIPSPNQQPISDTDRMLTNEKNIAAEIAEMEIRPTSFFGTTYNPKILSLSNHEDNSKDLSTIVQACDLRKRANTKQEDNQKSTTFILDRTKNSMITSQDNTTYHNYTGKNSQVPHITHAYTIVDTIEPTTELPQEHIGNLDHIMQPESSRTASTITMSPSTTTPTHQNPTLRVKNNESSVSILLANVQSLRNKNYF
ncbi:hypothetical protein JTB14_015730 [Gonioctena quinquepunctata]|nr:hypothetical protein JTB14_015730 [Gonioctena quinquepunctata]